MTKNSDFYLIKYDFELIFNIYENRPHLKSSLFDSKKMFPWKSLLEDVINDSNNIGYTFVFIDESNFKTMADKREMTYDF